MKSVTLLVAYFISVITWREVSCSFNESNSMAVVEDDFCDDVKPLPGYGGIIKTKESHITLIGRLGETFQNIELQAGHDGKSIKCFNLTLDDFKGTNNTSLYLFDIRITNSSPSIRILNSSRPLSGPCSVSVYVELRESNVTEEEEEEIEEVRHEEEIKIEMDNEEEREEQDGSVNVSSEIEWLKVTVFGGYWELRFHNESCGVLHQGLSEQDKTQRMWVIVIILFVVVVIAVIGIGIIFYQIKHPKDIHLPRVNFDDENTQSESRNGNGENRGRGRPGSYNGVDNSLYDVI